MDKNFIILMVEDEVSVMDVNRRMLKRRGYDLKEAKNAKEAYEFLSHTIPDLLILDIMLPDGNGYEICEFFRSKSDNPVIFLTGKVEVADKVQGLMLGGDYYLTKPYHFDELLAVVQRLLARFLKEQSVHENMSRIIVGNLVLDLSSYTAFIEGEDIHLTKKEFIMLKMFIENKGKELSTDEIYELAWGQSSAGDSRNVRKHIMNLRNKIKADESEYYDIFTVYGKGYSFVVFKDDKK